jgi:putative colanic acid biosynthesis UDP-glucose lipid carrier transferase
MACDALTIFLTSLLSGIFYHLYTAGVAGEPIQYTALAAVVSALFISLGKSSNVYDAIELLNLKSQVRKIAFKWIGLFLFLSSVAFAMKVGGSFSRGATISFFLSGLSALISTRVAWRIFLSGGFAVRKFSGRKAVLIAEQSSAASGIRDTLVRHGLQITEQYELPAARDFEGRKDTIKNVIASVRGSEVEEIVISANLERWPELNETLAELRVLPLPVNLVPFGPESDLFKLPSRTIGETVTVELQRGPRTLIERSIKRATDIVIASTALLLTLPLFLMTAVAIKLDSQGPIFFRQRRCGFNGRPFYILKFRSMSVLEDGPVIAQAERNDSRVTRIGNWLRRTSIDELPQLFNVLGGSMSIIGPRPHAIAHDNQFEKLVGNYAYRHHVKPGITGWAQVNGCRGRTCTVEDVENRVKLDLWYIDNWSLAVDLKIMAMTVIEVVRGENAY